MLKSSRAALQMKRETTVLSAGKSKSDFSQVQLLLMRGSEISILHSKVGSLSLLLAAELYSP